MRRWTHEAIKKAVLDLEALADVADCAEERAALLAASHVIGDTYFAYKVVVRECAQALVPIEMLKRSRESH